MDAVFFKRKKEDKLNKDEYTKFLEAQIIILKQENKRLINKIEKLSKSGIYKIGVDFDNDYIPKSKIREKIEQKRDYIDKELQKANSSSDEEIKERLWCASAMLEELEQELLEE